jgi:hypothetical protein
MKISKKQSILVTLIFTVHAQYKCVYTQKNHLEFTCGRWMKSYMALCRQNLSMADDIHP